MNITKRIRRIIREFINKTPKYLPDLDEAFVAKDIALKQQAVADKQLVDMRKGRPPRVFTVAANLLHQIPTGWEYSLFDIACGYGYYSEVISYMVPQLKINYIGGDFNEEMLKFAKQRYPDKSFQKEDIRALSMKDKSVGIVFSSATIAHLRDYRVGLRELARVCKSWLVLHRVGVVWRAKSSVEVQHHYDVDVYVNHISHSQLIQETDILGYKLVIEEPLGKKSIVGRQGMSFLFKRKE